MTTKTQKSPKTRHLTETDFKNWNFDFSYKSVSVNAFYNWLFKQWDQNVYSVISIFNPEYSWRVTDFHLQTYSV